MQGSPSLSLLSLSSLPLSQSTPLSLSLSHTHTRTHSPLLFSTHSIFLLILFSPSVSPSLSPPVSPILSTFCSRTLCLLYLSPLSLLPNVSAPYVSMCVSMFTCVRVHMCQREGQRDRGRGREGEKEAGTERGSRGPKERGREGERERGEII